MVKRGKAPAYTDAGGVAVLGQRCVRDGRVDWDTARKTDPSRKAVPTWAWICSGDILVNSTGHGTLGRTGFVGSVPVPSTVDSHVTIVRPDPTAVVPKFLAYMLRTMEHDLEALASGSTGQTELLPKLIAATSFALPSIEEQERIVDLLETVDAMEIATEELAKSGALATLVLREQLFSDLSEAFAALPLRDLMIRVRRPVSIGREQSYSQIGVRSHGKGIFHKDLVKGSDLGTKKVFWIHSGDLVFNIVFAWEGAVGLARPAEDGMCGSHRFPTYRPTSLSDVRFLWHLFASAFGRALLGLASPGSAGRNRTLNQDMLLDCMVPAPEIGMQKQIADLLDAAEALAADSASYSDCVQSARRSVSRSLLTGEHLLSDSYNRLIVSDARVL